MENRTDAIFKAIASGNSAALRSAFTEIPCEDACDALFEAGDALSDFYKYTLQLSSGNLTAEPTNRRIFIDAGVKQLHARLNHLVWQLTQISEGDYSQEVDYMGELSKGFNWMTAQLRLREAQLAYERDHDVLSGLLNREAFKRKVFDLISARPGETGIMLFSGLDDLKYVNDVFGHEAGDRYIAGAAEIFGAFKKIGAAAARISGDEFAVYLHGFAAREEAWQTVSNLLSQSGRKTFTVSQGRIRKIRFSAGAAWYPNDSGHVVDLIKYADHAMYEAKRSQKGSLVEFNKKLHLGKMNLLEKWESINRLIEEHLVHFAFQPILDTRDGSVYGYEALMRSKIKDFSSPIEILAVAAAQSLLPQIEKLTMTLIMQWLKENAPRLGRSKLFVNSIPTSILSPEDRAALKTGFADLMPNVVFEITEGAVEDEGVLTQKTSFIRDDFGAMVALDDYGSGYSGEMRLLKLNPDIVKIDRSFISGLHLDRNRQTLLANLISFCGNRNIKVLAEGVETVEELETVLELGFDLVQGYFFAYPDFDLKPIDADKLKALHRMNRTGKV